MNKELDQKSSKLVKEKCLKHDKNWAKSGEKKEWEDGNKVQKRPTQKKKIEYNFHC